MSGTGVSAFFDLMRQSVTIEPRTGQDRYNAPTYGAAVTYRCRIVGKRRLVVNGLGQTVVSEQTVYLGTANPVDPTARVTLSTADTGSTEAGAITPSILATGRYPDERGAHNSVIYL